MEYSTLYKKVETYVIDLFITRPLQKLVYHNLQHTQKVVERAKEIAAHYNLSDRDQLALYVAAWFHDVGYLFTEPAQHEAKSAELMREYLAPDVADTELLNTIADCIMATRFGTEPVTLLQQILADADTYHFGTREIDTTNKQVYKEYTLQHGFISKHDWNLQTLQMLRQHKYYTQYCKDTLLERKRKNIKEIRKKLEHFKVYSTGDEQQSTPNPESVKLDGLTTKGIQTMFRITSENHMKLSDMADGKANILISVNAIIISVILSVLLRRLQVDTYLTIPTIIFLTSSVVTIVVAILATRPKINEGTFSEQDIIDKKTNLLFFGNFYNCSFEDYEKAMVKMMGDSDYLYRSLIKDIYHLGVVLARKYKLIRYAYNIFMIGIVISVIAFAVSVVFSNGADGIITNAQGSPL